MRTHFSDQETLLMIRREYIDNVINTLDYYMWDSSSHFKKEFGVPTRDDVNQWIIVLSHRSDSNSEEVRMIIDECIDYCTIK